MPERTYTRAELEEVARMAAGAGAGAVMAKAPDVVMPTEDVLDRVQAVLVDFDERREGPGDGEIGTDSDFQFGGRAPEGADCCGKPKGCTNENPGCAFLRHPWKRIVAFGESPRPGDPPDLIAWAAGQGRAVRDG